MVLHYFVSKIGIHHRVWRGPSELLELTSNLENNCVDQYRITLNTENVLLPEPPCYSSHPYTHKNAAHLCIFP